MKRGRLAIFAIIAATALAPRAAPAQWEPPLGYSLAGGVFAHALTAGPDGNIWFSGWHGYDGEAVVGRVTPTGNVAEYPLKLESPRRASIVTGPDGALWFVLADGIGRVTTSGELRTFPLPSRGGLPTAIAVGPDGNLWLTESRGDRIARISTGGEITEFPLPAGREPIDIAAGPDGALWFTERGAGRIGRIDIEGRLSEFPVGAPKAKLGSIVLGTDGNLWFGDEATPRVGRMTPLGKVSEFPVPTAAGIGELISGPGGLLWFSSENEVAAISPAGVVSWPSCPVESCAAPAASLAEGSEGALWLGTGLEHCTSLCGGGTAIGLQLRPGGVGRYELPPLRLGIGPRVPPVRRSRTSVNLACGLESGCSGSVRLTYAVWPHGEKRVHVIAKQVYELAPREAKRIPIDLPGTVVASLQRYKVFYAVVMAGPPGQVWATRGIALEPARRRP